jgi:catechol 2,3-dioxygenase-like lactoylglutathione lyase family enzyme
MGWDDRSVLTQARFVGFLASTDLRRSRAFFEQLGLPCIEDSPFACVLDANGTPLRVTAVEEHTPQPFTVAGWEVDDMDAAVVALTGAGVVPLRFAGMDQDERGVWAAPGGAEVVWFADPDGNVLSLTRTGGA